jgi:ankyrin repeat protein
MQAGKKDINSEKQRTHSKSYKLHKAVWEGDIKRVKKLLKLHRYGVNDRDLHGNSPLHIAAHFANKELGII